ncbi:MAG: type IV pilus assembly protein PilM [Patescibacteria group bacterium]
MADIFKFFKNNLSLNSSYLGVDIGTTSIKVVEVERGGKLPRVINYGFLESGGYLARANQALQTSTLKLFEKEVVEFLRLILREMKTRSTEAVASLPVFSAFTTVLDFPDMSPADIEKAIPFQAKQYVPVSLSEVALDWMKVGEFTDERGFKHIQVLMVSVPQEQIKKYQKIFKLAGLKLSALELESLSLSRIFGGDDPTPTVIVDIGSRSTNVAFLEQGQFRFNTQSDFAGASLTQALATGLGITSLRAEELKKERGINGVGPGFELSTIMLPFLDAIIGEVKNSIFKYQNQFPQARKIERLMLAGGGANLSGIETYFGKEFNFPIVKAAPFAQFECHPNMTPMLSELNPLMSVALGLALQRFKK